MPLLARVLLVLLGARLLMPPGICACQWCAPAARLACALLGDDRPIPPPEHDDDHTPGCPASGLAEGMGVHPPAVPALDPAALPLPLDPPAIPAPTARTASPSPTGHTWPGIPLFLWGCALLI